MLAIYCQNWIANRNWIENMGNEMNKKHNRFLFIVFAFLLHFSETFRLSSVSVLTWCLGIKIVIISFECLFVSSCFSTENKFVLLIKLMERQLLDSLHLFTKKKAWKPINWLGLECFNELCHIVFFFVFLVVPNVRKRFQSLLQADILLCCRIISAVSRPIRSFRRWSIRQCEQIE